LERIFRDRVIDDFYFTDIQLIQLKDLNNDEWKLSGGALPFIWYVLKNVKKAFE